MKKGKYPTKYLLSSRTNWLLEQNKIRYKLASVIAIASAGDKLWFWHYYRVMKKKENKIRGVIYFFPLDWFQNKLESEIFSHDLNLDNFMFQIFFFFLFIINFIASELRFNFFERYIFFKSKRKINYIVFCRFCIEVFLNVFTCKIGVFSDTEWNKTCKLIASISQNLSSFRLRC